MADPLSVFFGVLSIAGLFSTVTEIWSLVEAGKDYSKDFSFFSTRLNNQRERLVQWGREMGFSSESGYDKRLDEPRMRLRIEETLHHIKLILSDADALVGVHRTDGSRIDIQEGNELPSRGSPSNAWKTSYERFRYNLRQNQRKSSIIKTTRWSVKDGPDFKKLVARISELLDDLYDLTKDLITEQRRGRIALAEPNNINNLDQQRELQRGHPNETVHAGAALSISPTNHLYIIESGYAENFTSSAIESQSISSDIASNIPASAYTTFYTGNSHQTRPTMAGTMAGDDHLLEADGIKDQTDGIRECMICATGYSLQAEQVRRSLTSTCEHDLAICMPCIARCIRSDLEYGCDRVRCPECREKLSEDDIRFFADSDTIILYEELNKRAVANHHNTFLESEEHLLENGKKCPGCGRLIVKCERCDHMTCRRCQTEFCWGCLVNYDFIRKEGNQRHKKNCLFYMDNITNFC